MLFSSVFPSTGSSCGQSWVVETPRSMFAGFSFYQPCRGSRLALRCGEFPRDASCTLSLKVQQVHSYPTCSAVWVAVTPPSIAHRNEVSMPYIDRPDRLIQEMLTMHSAPLAYFSKTDNSLILNR